MGVVLTKWAYYEHIENSDGKEIYVQSSMKMFVLRSTNSETVG